MAGDWTPLRDNIHDDPDVLTIAAALGVRDSDLVVGKLTRFWAWASQHSRDGSLGVSGEVVDRIAKCKGLAAACLSVGWLVNDDGGLRIPKFDRWMSRSAKARLGEAKRKQINRNRPEDCPDNGGQMSGQMSGHSSGQMSGQKRDHSTGQDSTEQNHHHQTAAAEVSIDGLTESERAKFEALVLAGVGDRAAAALAVRAAFSIESIRKVAGSWSQQGKPPSGALVEAMKTAARQDEIRSRKRAERAAGGAA